eukprot:2538511-Prymnesium_polylepis.1
MCEPASEPRASRTPLSLARAPIVCEPCEPCGRQGAGARDRRGRGVARTVQPDERMQVAHALDVLPQPWRVERDCLARGAERRTLLEQLPR